MKRVLLALALTLLPALAYAQPRGNVWSTKGQKEFESALTLAGWFGAPRSTTALLPTCATSNKGALRFDTTTSTLKICDGSTWTSPGGASLALDNLASVAINTALLPGATGKDLGAALTPFQFLYLHGAGTYGTGSLKFTGTPTAARTVTFPDADISVAQLGAQSFTGLQTMGGGGRVTVTAGMLLDEDVPLLLATIGKIIVNSSQTSRALSFGANNAFGNAFIFSELQDMAFNFAHPQQTSPTLFIHSQNQSATQWVSLYHNATSGVLSAGTPLLVQPAANTGADAAGRTVTVAGGVSTGTGAGGDLAFQTSPSAATSSVANAVSDRAVMVAKAKALTAASATSFVRISLPALSMAGGVVEYSIQASDGTDMQSLSGFLAFSVVNKAGVETCTLSVTSTQDETLVAASAVSTLTNTFTCDTSPTNGVDIAANAASSLTETTLQIVYQIRLNGAVGSPTITPQ